MSRIRPARLERLQRISSWTLLAAVLLAALGATLAPVVFLYAWLMAVVFWTGVSLGCLALLMLHYLTGGVWGILIRRPLEAAARALPLMALFFVPLLLNLDRVYPWDQPNAALDEVVRQKQVYLNAGFYVVRTIVCFAIWSGLAWWFARRSHEQDEQYDLARAQRMQRVAAPGLIVYAVTVTFAVTDWVMSLEPHWYSTIFGFLFIGGQGLSGIAFAIIVAAWLRHDPALADVAIIRPFHDLGKLLLTFVVLWAYLAFSQYLIIWAENLPLEIVWYVHRSGTGWQAVAVLLIVLHFAVPFLLLLSRRLKRRIGPLVAIAAGIVAMRVVDLFWLVMPELYEGRLQVHWLHPVALLAVGAAWVALFAHGLRAFPLLPLHDPEADYLRQLAVAARAQGEV
jgi:hypothetical protein